MATVLMIIAPEGFRDEELFLTQVELEKAGHKIVIASLVKGVCRRSHGGSATATLILAEIEVENYEAVVFVGGNGSKVYFTNRDALRIAQEMAGQGKVVAAICVAPVILANAGLLQGKNSTVFGSEIKAIEGKGAKYTGAGLRWTPILLPAMARRAPDCLAGRSMHACNVTALHANSQGKQGAAHQPIGGE